MNPTRRAHPDSKHHDEARELRRIIREQRAEIESLRTALEEVAEIASHSQTDQDHASNQDDQ